MLTTARKCMLSSTPNIKNSKMENSQWTGSCCNNVFYYLLLFNFIKLQYSNGIHLKTDNCERTAFSSTNTEQNEYRAV